MTYTRATRPFRFSKVATSTERVGTWFDFAFSSSSAANKMWMLLFLPTSNGVFLAQAVAHTYSVGIPHYPGPHRTVQSFYQSKKQAYKALETSIPPKQCILYTSIGFSYSCVPQKLLTALAMSLPILKLHQVDNSGLYIVETNADVPLSSAPSSVAQSSSVLRVNIYRPNTSEKVPVLVTYGPCKLLL